MSAVEATAEEAREIIRIIENKQKPDSLPAYVATLTRNGDLAGFLDRVRAGERAAHSPTASTPVPPPLAEQLGKPPCPHGTPGGDQPRPGIGTPPCPQCRRAAPTLAQRPTPSAPAGPPDLSSLRAALADLASSTDPQVSHLPAAPPLPAVGPPPYLQEAHGHLNTRGDRFDWLAVAREKLGSDAHRNEVVALAAELAQQGARP